MKQHKLLIARQTSEGFCFAFQFEVQVASFCASINQLPLSELAVLVVSGQNQCLISLKSLSTN
jgi:hypothetical protein